MLWLWAWTMCDASHAHCKDQIFPHIRHLSHQVESSIFIEQATVEQARFKKANISLASPNAQPGHTRLQLTPHRKGEGRYPAPTRQGDMKGNKGKGARRRLFQRLAIVISSFGIIFSMLRLARRDRSSDGDANSNHLFGEKSSLLGLKSLKKLRGGTEGLFGGPKSLTKQDSVDDAVWQDILHARVHLVDLTVHVDEVNMMPSAEDDEVQQYMGVYAEFCRVDWGLHKKDPSAVPMFRDLVAKSPGCAKDRIKVDLAVVIDRVREFDEANLHAENSRAPTVLDLAAVVFHESRCGSTLVANLFASMNPSEHRVYSESGPPLAALYRVCGEAYERCSFQTAAAVFKDVIYLMQRSDDPQETRVFFKIQSAGTRNLPVFLDAFPTTPWLFVYREPVQVMMSHLPVGMKNIRQSNCVRAQARGPVPKTVQDILHRHFHSSAKSVSPIEYCAAHLASITETAVEALQNNEDSKMGVPVNYRDLPTALWEVVLPNVLHIPTGQAEIHRMQVTAGVYSKGREHTGKRGSFEEDSETKEAAASPEIRTAAQAILNESYQSLENASAVIMELLQ
jgi:hypothetical protein